MMMTEKLWESYAIYGNTLNYFIGRLKEKSYQEILDSTGDQNFIDFAESGIFAYDYGQVSELNPGRFYKLMKAPSKPITVDDLTLERHYVDAIPRLNVIFGEPQINCEKLDLE